MMRRCSKCKFFRVIELTHCLVTRNGAHWVYLCSLCMQKERFRLSLGKDAPSLRPILNPAPLMLKRAREVQS